MPITINNWGNKMVKFNYVIIDATSKRELYCFHRDMKLDYNEQQELILLFKEIFPQFATRAVELVEFADHVFPEDL